MRERDKAILDSLKKFSVLNRDQHMLCIFKTKSNRSQHVIDSCKDWLLKAM
jgi:hypothetical protein